MLAQTYFNRPSQGEQRGKNNGQRDLERGRVDPRIREDDNIIARMTTGGGEDDDIIMRVTTYSRG